jgi:hypothetical protein
VTANRVLAHYALARHLSPLAGSKKSGEAESFGLHPFSDPLEATRIGHRWRSSLFVPAEI